MIIPDGNILTNLLKDFSAVTSASRPLIEGYAWKVFITLTTIDVIILGLYWTTGNTRGGKDGTGALMEESMRIASFSFMILFYKDIVNALSASFVKIGLIAGGNVLSIADFTNPSKITTMGFDLVMPFVQNIVNGKSLGGTGGGLIDVVKSIPSSILLGLVYILILFCFFIIAINIFVIYLEFAIFTSMALILVPFGVWDKTAFIFEKAKNGIINFGIKYMTLAFVVSISMSLIQKWQLPPDPTIQQALYVLVGMLGVTYLCCHAPSVAAGMAGGGGGSMSAAAAGGFVGAAAGKAGSVGGVGKTVGKAMVGGVNQNTGTRSGILPTIGRMTGATAGMSAAAAKVADMGKDFGNNISQKFSGKPPATTTSGVNLNSGTSDAYTKASQTPDTGTTNTTPDIGTSTQSAAKTAGPTNPMPSGADIAPSGVSSPTTAPSPKGPPPIKTSGINIPQSPPNTNSTTL